MLLISFGWPCRWHLRGTCLLMWNLLITILQVGEQPLELGRMWPDADREEGLLLTMHTYLQIDQIKVKKWGPPVLIVYDGDWSPNELIGSFKTFSSYQFSTGGSGGEQLHNLRLQTVNYWTSLHEWWLNAPKGGRGGIPLYDPSTSHQRKEWICDPLTLCKLCYCLSTKIKSQAIV